MAAPHIDRNALAAIRAEPVDWRFKGMPATVFGQTVGEVAEAGLDLFTDGFVGPVMVLDDAALTHNLTTMADWCARTGMSLAPHGKTTMAPQLFARQLQLGAWGMTTANISQLRVYRAFGVRRILLANELVDPAGLRWLAGELAADPEFEFTCWADSVRGVELMDSALRAAGAVRPVHVLVELGAPGGRTGARDLATGTEVGAAIAASPVLRLAGAGGYEGVLTHGADADAWSILAGYLDRLRTLAGRLPVETEEIIVSAGGSAYFDRVAEALRADLPADRPVRPLLRSGAYVTHDDGFYRELSPLGEHPRLVDVPPFRPALHVWAQVSSRPEPGLGLLTLGKRDASFDEGLPEPHRIRRAGADPTPLSGWYLRKFSDQHAFLTTDDPSAADPVEIGDWIEFGLSHPCTAFDKWSLLPVLGGPTGSTVVDLVRTYF
jgi:D-serine deaminase-like pyridoxal phosphate-dependent protein